MKLPESGKAVFQMLINSAVRQDYSCQWHFREIVVFRGTGLGNWLRGHTQMAAPSAIIFNMCRPWPLLALIVLSSAALVIPGCQPKQKPQPVIVRIFRDLNSPYARELDHRILEFQASNPRLANGGAIQVESFQSSDYQRAAKNLDEPEVEVFVLNSPDDVKAFPALQAELGHAVNVCAAFKACPQNVPAFVPAKVSGERAEAANKFVAFLASKQ